jgi:hypothetical protein
MPRELPRSMRLPALPPTIRPNSKSWPFLEKKLLQWIIARTRQSPSRTVRPSVMTYCTTPD